MATTQITIEEINASDCYLNWKSKKLLNAKIELKEGDLFKINSQAEFPKIGRYYQYDTNTANPDFEFPVGSLIGTVDGGKTFFPVAGNLEMMCLDTEPKGLSLVFWGVDADTAINPVTVSVEVEDNRALNEVQAQAETEPSNAFFQDRFQFAVHAIANSVGKTQHPSYPTDGWQVLEPLLETGIQLKPGDLLIVDVPPQDLWSADGGSFVNANGITVPDGRRIWVPWDYKSHNYRISSLVATIDDGKTFFPVGTHLQMTVLNRGMLCFAYWDLDWNNRAFVKACVKVIRNGKVLTSLDINTINKTGNISGSTSELGTSNGNGNDYSSLDCSANLPKLSTKLKSNLSAAK
ncbi:MAG: hypothetical protein AAGE84_26010 [Cyanobacteria bacterium P01_G01_bin.39]